MEAADAARARSLRASIAGLMRAVRECADAAPASCPRGAPGDRSPSTSSTRRASRSPSASANCRATSPRSAPSSRGAAASAVETAAPAARAVKGRGRCRLHGGASTGPRTSEGKLRTLAGAVARRRGMPFEEALELVRAERDPARARHSSP